MSAAYNMESLLFFIS